MSKFMPEPSRFLATAGETLEAIRNPEWMKAPHPFRWHVKSQWLCGLIDEYAATGKYPYNADVQRLAEDRLGIGPLPESGSPLSTLVYNAQNYRRSDMLIAAGFTSLTQDMIEDAFKLGLKIETRSGVQLTVREIDGKRYAFKPRKRKLAVMPDGSPAKLITA